MSIDSFKLNPLEMVNSCPDPTNTIDVSHYSRGIYFVTIKSDKGILNKKIIIE